MMFSIFISSVQKEFAAERKTLAEYIRGDALLRKHFEVFRFEELPPTDRRPGDLYLDAVDRADVYVGLFGVDYGSEDEEGCSPTEREFDRATQRGLNRLVFVKGGPNIDRDPKMESLIRRVQTELIRRRFSDISDLIAPLYASLIEHLEREGVIATRPLDAAAHPDASLDEISPDRIQRFLARARAARNYAVDPGVPVAEALAHLKMLDRDRPSNAALLLFGKDTQERFPSAEMKCMHFHGTEVRKPIPSYHLYKGDLFEQVDQAIDFVLSKLNRAIGTREHGPEASRTYEIPVPVIQESIVNAVAHRDYASTAGVQVYVFADRVEVMNPGALPEGITLDDLRRPHASHPRYPLIADALYLTHYIEKAGTGTLDMIAGCREAGLPEPEFREQGNHFVVTVWRDWLTGTVISELGLSVRQTEAVRLIRVSRRITNTEFQETFGVSKATATRDLERLVKIGVLKRVGTTGVGTHYTLASKRLTKGSNDSVKGKGS
jgi:predicted HTH transcriptional regulator